MMKIFLTLMTAAGLLFVQTASASPAVDALLDEYRAAGAGAFSADVGQSMWMKTQGSNKAPLERRCSSCHTNDLSNAGKHVMLDYDLRLISLQTCRLVLYRLFLPPVHYNHVLIVSSSKA